MSYISYNGETHPLESLRDFGEYLAELGDRLNDPLSNRILIEIHAAEYLVPTQHMTVSALANLERVSKNTIRRRLKELVAIGMAQRRAALIDGIAKFEYRPTQHELDLFSSVDKKIRARLKNKYKDAYNEFGRDVREPIEYCRCGCMDDIKPLIYPLSE